MKRYLPYVAFFVLAAAALYVSLILRTQLMENDRWVGLCLAEPERLECQIRASLGWLIHFSVIAYSALAVAVIAFIWRGRAGQVLAGLSLLIGLPALVLYSASLGVIAVVLALLRLVRATKSA
ncbi:hypothetical protein WG219_14225 [Ectopseudomonas mendocina]|uniref:Uncharacterized protein n=1 Tax=Ectopseudomonas mendocina TaxID=300 RepID=A0ABZ2RCH0_ECTME